MTLPLPGVPPHAVRVTSNASEVEQLRVAVERRTTIGMALGILMERFDLDQRQAFDYVAAVRVS